MTCPDCASTETRLMGVIEHMGQTIAEMREVNGLLIAQVGALRPGGMGGKKLRSYDDIHKRLLAQARGANTG